MPSKVTNWLRRLLSRWPLQDKLGVYAFGPLFFLGGATYEYLCIHMNINNVTFYKYHRNKRVEEEYIKYLIIHQDDGEETSEDDLQRLFRSYRSKSH